MPSARAPLATVTEQTPGQGGTALQAESEQNWGWIVGGIAFVGIVIFLLTRGSDSDTPIDSSPLTDPLVANTQLSPSEESTVAPTAGKVQNPVEEEDTTLRERQRDAISELSLLLDKSRLWATLSVSETSDSILAIVSGACEDNAMKPTLRKAVISLKAAGFQEAHCRAKHGELLFTEIL